MGPYGLSARAESCGWDPRDFKIPITPLLHYVYPSMRTEYLFRHFEYRGTLSGTPSTRVTLLRLRRGSQGVKRHGFTVSGHSIGAIQDG